MPSIAIMEGSLVDTLELLARHPDICFDVKENLAFTEVATFIRNREPGTPIVPFTFPGVVLYSMWFECAVTAGFAVSTRIDFTHGVLLVHAANKDEPWSMIQFKPAPVTEPVAFCL